jgi:hemolysin III
MVRLRERTQSRGEEIANSVSHGVGAVAATVGAVFMMVVTVRRGDVAQIVGAGVFSATMLLVYLTSTLYHAITREKPKRVFRVLDHGAIFLLIAGTYTPFTLGVLRGPWGWTLLSVVWCLAIAGIVLTAVSRLRYPTLSTVIYVAMGWLFVVGVKPLWTNMQPWGLVWLLAGGVAYTGGVAFFAADRIRYGHLVWHIFVIAGTACHYIAVLKYAV